MRGSAAALQRRVDPRFASFFNRQRILSLLALSSALFTLLVLYNQRISLAESSFLNRTPEGLGIEGAATGATGMTYEKDESDSREETAFQLEINEGDEAAGTSEQSADARRDPSDHHTTMTAPNRQKQHKSIPPFLPFSCPVPPSAPAIYPPIPARRKSRWEEPVPGSDAILLAPLVARSVHFRGTGSEVKRVLRRAVKSSLYGVQRKREGDIGSEGGALEDERGFRILVLGGSVSNCRAVDTEGCWHSYLLRWFHESLPLKHDPAPTSSSSPHHAKRAERLPSHDNHRAFRKSSKNAAASGSSTRGRIMTRLINSAKSATGSAFFAYCFEQEMKFRRKSTEWGTGPDLIILEFGVNDVYPVDEMAQRDFERLLYKLRGMASNPAIIILEAASLFLKDTEGRGSAVDIHLRAAIAQDVVILSAAKAIFDEPDLLSTSSTKTEDLFLVDRHHPNLVGHFLLGQIVTDYLEGIACEVQWAILANAERRIALGDAGEGRRGIEAGLDVGRRSEEVVLPLQETSCFGGSSALSRESLAGPTTCLQIGLTRSNIRPIENEGWANYVYSRDKQYLIAEKPGSIVSFDLLVRGGGEIIVDWLRSQFYSLGDVLVYVDDDKSNGVQIAGYWNLGWSIGVPTAVFRNVSAGSHRITFKLLPSSQSSNPKGKSSGKVAFRLIGLIAT